MARKIASTEQEIAAYKSKIEKASKAKEEQKILKDKLEIITSLQNRNRVRQGCSMRSASKSLKRCISRF